MPKFLLGVLALVATASLIGAGCLQSETETDTAVEAKTTPGSWVPSTQGPWDGSLFLVRSTDGTTFTGKTHILDSAGVPNLLRLSDGTLVLTYQYFSRTSEDLFNVIAYSASDDNGNTWSDPAKVTLTDLPAPLDADKVPMDPTLVQLPDGRLRLYFTYHAKGARTASLFSATAPDDVLTSTFTVAATPALAISTMNLLDPSVTYFDGVWHHYSWEDGSDNNIHSTSTDGVTFTRQADVTLPMDFLGQVIPVDNGLRFYGTGKGGVQSATSTDGTTWAMDTGSRAQGADPGVQELADGTYIMVYTSMNFNN